MENEKIKYWYVEVDYMVVPDSYEYRCDNEIEAKNLWFALKKSPDIDYVRYGYRTKDGTYHEC